MSRYTPVGLNSGNMLVSGLISRIFAKVVPGAFGLLRVSRGGGGDGATFPSGTGTDSRHTPVDLYQLNSVQHSVFF